MAAGDRVILDQLTHKHELMDYDPTDPELSQIVTVEQGGRTLEVIVPLFYDETRVGEVVHAAITSETVFLLCRYDKPFDDFFGTLGLLVVAVPYGEGRYRAAIAHVTYALDRLGLYPMSER